MKYHNITKDDMLNGDGLRVVLWVSGCNHECKGCHNVITWDADCGLVFEEDIKEEIFRELDKDYISGITFSGGDPLHEKNRKEVEDLIKEIKIMYPDKSIWLYTGFTLEEISDLDMIKYIDVLIDGKYEEELKSATTYWRGSSNQRVIDVKKSRKAGQVILYCD